MSPLNVWIGGLTVAVLAALAVGLGWVALAVVRLSGRLADLAARVDRLAPPPANGAEPSDRKAIRGAAASAPATAAHPASTLISVPNLGAPGGPDSAREQGEALSQRYRAIWELSDAGAAPAVIAEATGLAVGRVEVILGLRPHARRGPQ